jgi:phosphopentomutase
MNKKRVIILMMDSLGVGSSKDAIKFNDEGSNTFRHIYESYPMHIPNLEKKGLTSLLGINSTEIFDKKHDIKTDGAYGFAAEKSSGKDTISGHWEIVGCPVLFDWTYFNQKDKNGSYFPLNFIENFTREAKILDGVIDAGQGSGTEIINRFGDLHKKTKKPIIYTSADSVFQIACHEEYYGLDALYKISRVARNILDSMALKVGRVIARPFIGEKAGDYLRTVNRKDFSVPPPYKTLLDNIVDAGGNVISIGKISDIFSHQGISKKVKSYGLPDLIDKTISEIKTMSPSSLLFTNFVNFDCDYGHRRDLKGYAKALEYFDYRLPEINNALCESDMVVLCADHGCDPTWIGNDHTREFIPFLIWGKSIKPGFMGCRKTFSDIGATIAEFLDTQDLFYGTSCSQFLNL